MKILLADDEPDILALYCEMLEGNGFEVNTAHDGKQTLEQIANETYSLLILDLHMPQLSGFEVLKALRSSGQEIPVIVMTGHYPEEEVSKRIQGLDVDIVLRKPVMITTLLDAVNTILKKSR